MKRREIRIDAVYDIECSNWTEFVCGGYLRSDGDYQLFSNHISAPSQLNDEAMASHILASGGFTWAHFGGKYDHKWLIDIAARRGYSVNIGAAGSRIVTAQCGHLALRDSWALIPVSLKELTESQGVKKEALNLPCICGENCAGYCSISRTMPTAQYKRLCDYLEADCRSLFESLMRVQEFARENDIDLGPTVGSSSWRTIQRWLDIPAADLDANDHTFARRGYYGGRTQLYLPGLHENVYENDVSSMYSWSMRDHEMPCGFHQRFIGRDALSCFARQKPGIYAATIDVPKMHLPPLPYRTPKRIAYPTGRIQGGWSLPELEYAISRGCDLKNVAECIVWSDSRFLFGPYVNKIFELRMKAGKKTPQGIWLKYMLNAPTGKMGSNPDKERFMVNPTHFKKCPGVEPCMYDGVRDCGKCCAIHCNRRCGAMSEHSEYIWSEYKYSLDACAHVEKAAYLTAYARIELNTNQIAKNEGKDVIMSDTDSIFSLEDRDRNRGSDCGQWEFKGKCEKFYGIAPKTYWYERDGKIVSRAKGINAPKDKPIEVEKNYPARGVVGLKSGAKLGVLFSAKTMGRQAQRGVGDRVLLRDGKTRAPTIEEVERGIFYED